MFKPSGFALGQHNSQLMFIRYTFITTARYSI